MSDKRKRRRWTAGEKLRIVLAGLDGSVEVSELCRREGINPTQYYGWKKQLLGAAGKVFDNGPEAKPSAKEQRLICQLQMEHLRGSSKFDDEKAEVLNDISQLRINLTQVAVKAPVINQLKSNDFWSNVSVPALEQIRIELRGVMQYRLKPTGPSLPPRVFDIKEEDSLVERKKFIPKLEGLELGAYRNRVLV